MIVQAMPYPAGSGGGGSHVWTIELSQDYRSSLSWHFMAWAVMNGGEVGDILIGLTHVSSSANRHVGLSIWRGCTATPIEALASNVSGAAGNTVNAVSPNITTLGANRTVINLVSAELNSTQTPPAGYTEVYDVLDSGGSQRAMTTGLNYKTVASAGAVGTSTTVLSSSARFGVITFGLIPSGGSAPTLVGHDINPVAVPLAGERFVTCTYPPGIQAGDIAILHCNMASGGSDANASLSTLPS